MTEYTNELTEVNAHLVNEVAERKKTEEALQRSEEQLRLTKQTVNSPNQL